MVDQRNVWRIVTDAARLIGEGELVVFGSSALAFWLGSPPVSRDVDIWCEPSSKADSVQALMGELSWYHDRHGTWVEVWAPETFAAPIDWRARAKHFEFDDVPKVRVVIPHPHDLIMAKLERMDPKDHDHVERVLKEKPLTVEGLAALAAQSPYRQGRIQDPLRVRAFELHLAELRRVLEAAEVR
ncbi:MAG: DUF6036 family nucleotidyltransferase [Myxococcaceae bacterium]